MSGRIEGIYLCAAGGAPMSSVERTEAVAGAGLAGDRYLTGSGYWSGRGSDPVTLVGAEALDALGVEPPLEHGEARRNLVLRGVDPTELIGRRFRVGSAVVLEGIRPCDPCGYLEALTRRPGLKAALSGRGGLRADVVEGGTIRVGDEISVLDE